MHDLNPQTMFRNLPLKLSINLFCIGLPGATMYNATKPVASLATLISLLMSFQFHCHSQSRKEITVLRSSTLILEPIDGLKWDVSTSNADTLWNTHQ